VENITEGMGSVIDGARWQVSEKMEAVRKTIPAKVSNSWVGIISHNHRRQAVSSNLPLRSSFAHIVPLLGQRLRAGPDARNVRVLSAGSEIGTTLVDFRVKAARLFFSLLLLSGFFFFHFLKCGFGFFGHVTSPPDRSSSSKKAEDQTSASSSNLKIRVRFY
jgi:hypothetical protein